jgi:phospholipase/carboxylesterase
MSEIKKKGLSLDQAKKALIMIHGRGATAESILSLSSYLNSADYAILAPQANSNTWYPYGFMASDKGNLVALESSIKQIQEAVKEVTEAGISSENLYFLGFSQGACLSLEFVTRHAKRYGGVVAFTGGLIGETIDVSKYSGDFQKTPVFIGGSKTDFHVPAKRMQETKDLMKSMGAVVTLELYNDPEHTIRREELEWVNEQIFL